MRNEIEKFHETIGILVNAYLNDKLSRGSCTMCAVGNIVFAKLGYCNGFLGGWAKVFYTNSMDGYGVQHIDLNEYEGGSRKEIDSTGYSISELMKIEYSFEMADRDYNEDKYMFNGLMAVVDVLAEIHGVDLTIRENAKTLFVK